MKEVDKKRLLENWLGFVERTKKLKAKPTSEKSRKQRIEKAKKDYGYFCEYYFEHYCLNEKDELIPNAPFHNKLANQFLDNKQIKISVEWARALAKSTHVDLFIPLWLMIQDDKQINTLVLVGKNQTSATILLQGLQAELQYNERFIEDFGQQYSHGNWSDSDFTTKNGVSFMALGMGQSPRGLRKGSKRPDFIICDDLDYEELCRNEIRVEEVVQWILRALIPAMDIGTARFAFVNNRISDKGILAKLVERNPHWTHSKVNALDEKGNPSWKAKYTKAFYTKLRKDIGTNAFMTEYQNTPITEGNTFKKEWIAWRKILPLKDYRAIVSYCDPSFKATKTADYKAIATIGLRSDGTYDLIDLWVRQRKSINDMVSYHYDLHERILKEGATAQHYMEANFIQDMHLQNYISEGKNRGYQLAIRADKQAKSAKESRIEAMSPLYENTHIYHNIEKQKDNDFKTYIEQLLAFGSKGAHDDAPDAVEGAISMLQKTLSSLVQPTIGRFIKNTIRSFYR
ncbi:MAG: hypothetical protein COZ16_12275 [Flavobacteriaceae bacterium CG_4_10_14_3_um_filter_31_253]|nr:MAG: hypothetical protein COZ16_12275 [Flavobacteriaceae bacterium CG_4_10_14_3_um_filter_31_253]